MQRATRPRLTPLNSALSLTAGAAVAGSYFPPELSVQNANCDGQPSRLELLGNSDLLPSDSLPRSLPRQFPALETVTKPNLTTGEAAHFLNRRPQTLRAWACRSGSGPIVPTRIGGILAWSTSTVKKLAGVTA